jgi:hypothetical protein
MCIVRPGRVSSLPLGVAQCKIGEEYDSRRILVRNPANRVVGETSPHSEFPIEVTWGLCPERPISRLAFYFR